MQSLLQILLASTVVLGPLLTQVSAELEICDACKQYKKPWDEAYTGCVTPMFEPDGSKRATCFTTAAADKSCSTGDMGKQFECVFKMCCADICSEHDGLQDGIDCSLDNGCFPPDGDMTPKEFAEMYG
jgi:hypothetical protein